MPQRHEQAAQEWFKNHHLVLSLPYSNGSFLSESSNTWRECVSRDDIGYKKQMQDQLDFPPQANQSSTFAWFRFEDVLYVLISICVLCLQNHLPALKMSFKFLRKANSNPVVFRNGLEMGIPFSRELALVAFHFLPVCIPDTIPIMLISSTRFK